MEIKHKLPPNYEAIKQVLNPTENTIYCYGNTIYNPSGLPISDDLMVHEQTHSVQQASMGIDNWWKLYLEDDQFRLDQEVEAYRAQAQYADANYSRPLRRTIKKEITKHLSSNLYGNLISKEEAKKLIYE